MLPCIKNVFERFTDQLKLGPCITQRMLPHANTEFRKEGEIIDICAPFPEAEQSIAKDEQMIVSISVEMRVAVVSYCIVIR